MRTMQVADRISDIEKRAARINLKLFPLCKAAGVSWGNLRRWRDGEVSPTVNLFEKTLAALELKLSEREQEILKNLTNADTRERRAS